MIRHLVAGTAAVLLIATPAIAFAANNSSSYSDTKVKKVAHKAAKPHKAKTKKPDTTTTTK